MSAVSVQLKSSQFDRCRGHNPLSVRRDLHFSTDRAQALDCESAGYAEVSRAIGVARQQADDSIGIRLRRGEQDPQLEFYRAVTD